MNFSLVLVVILMSALLTGLLRRYALLRQMIDVPNERSSHTTPTPRGGGVAIVLSYLVATALLWNSGAVDWKQALAMVGSGGLIALVGFMDDHGHIPARWRLLGHFAGAALMIFMLGGVAPLEAFGYRFDLGIIGSVLGAVFLVWMLNLYNFMDGIDGLASCEAITACCTVGAVYCGLGYQEESWTLFTLAASVIGFLLWNFPPAKIFMGDAGSGFLGLMVGFLVLVGAALDARLVWVWLIAIGVFVVDATFTLVIRLLKGAKPYEAHRSHAYQRASRHYGSHRKVTVAVIAINLLWLLPLALGVGWLGWDGASCTALAYAPLILIAVKLGAGQPEG